MSGAITEEERKLEADSIYVLMKKEYRISRYIRAQWFVSHLGKSIEPKSKQSMAEFAGEIEVLSVLPKVFPSGWCEENAHQYSYLVTPDTKVIFLAKKYRFVFCLDLSPSIASVDILSETLLFDEVLPALKQCVQGLIKPFYVPGSCTLFQPYLYITVIAHVPHYTPAIQQVLIQGWPLTKDNLNSFLEHVSNRLQEIGIALAEATAGVNELHEQFKLQSEKLTGVLFEETGDQLSLSSQVTMVASDASTVNMLKYGMLALQLLPENSSAGIIVITDGMISLPNSSVLESLLTHMRNSTVSCSFLQLGSNYHPKCCLSYTPFSDLMQFIARATFGAYLPCHLLSADETEHGINFYHKALLLWSFQEELMNRKLELASPVDQKFRGWLTGNSNFRKNENQQFLKKKHSEGTLFTSLSSVLSCKLREGYAVRRISFNKGEIDVRMVLPWRYDVNIEYGITVGWQKSSGDLPNSSQYPSCKYEVYVEASYDFLHDVTCEFWKSVIKSPYRSMVIKQYWNVLKNIHSNDQLLVHLHSFNQNPAYYSIPDSIRNGFPLFYMSATSSHPSLSSKNAAHSQFANFWKPVCMLDINIWQKWMHIHRIGILLEHDMPLPKYLQQPNSSGRYDQVQCRQALNSLTALLRDFSSFVLVDNHSYIKLLFKEPDKPPETFYMIRVVYKAPCMVIRLAFLGGTPGHLRNKIVKELCEKITELRFPKRGVIKEIASDSGYKSPLQRDWMDVKCCVMFRKPIERILIRYEKVPRDVLSPVVIPPEQFSLSRRGSLNDPANSSILTSLSKYLHHRRWVWTIQHSISTPLPLHSVTRILKTLTKIRLQECFHFAHSNSGIINMILEIEMKNTVRGSAEEGGDICEVTLPCIVQYILFPPHSNTTIRESLSDDDDMEVETTEADGELQLITECWIEPQCGSVMNCSVPMTYIEGKEYSVVPKALFEMDFECISSLITLEHLNLMCNNHEVPCPSATGDLPPTPPTTPVTEAHMSLLSASRSTPDVMLSQGSLHHITTSEPTIGLVPFSFDVMKLLSKCQQTELLFSSCIQELFLGDVGGCMYMVPCLNTLLFEYLMENLKLVHDRELFLTSNDQSVFPTEVYNRPRDVHVYNVPFSLSDVAGNVMFPMDSPLLSHAPNVMSRKPSLAAGPLNGQETPRWKCYVKSFSKNSSNSHVALTFVPASFHDLKTLMLRNFPVSEKTLKVVPPRDINHSEKMPPSTGNQSPHLDTSFSQSDGQPKTFQEGRSPRSCQISSQVQDEVLSPRASSAMDGGSGDFSHNLPAPAFMYGAITIPVYIYDAPLSTVINKFIYQGGIRKWRDMYQDHTFRHGDNFCRGDASDVADYLEAKHLSPEPKSDDSEIACDRLIVKKHCNVIQNAFFRSFVYSVFRNLQEGRYVDRQDIESVVDLICDESVLTIDITEFLQVICGHTKDFRIKASVEHTHKVQDKSLSGRSLQNNSESDEGSNPASECPKSPFPIDLLQRHHPCEGVQQLHMSIKHRFQDILQEVFQPVPTCQDYYYFCPPNYQQNNLVNLGVHGDKNGEYDWPLSDSDKSDGSGHTVEFSSDVEGRTQDVGTSCSASQHANEERISDVSKVDTASSGHESIAEDDEAMETIQEAEPVVPPLFAHLTCLITTKNATGSCSLTSLPTCLGEVIKCLERSEPMLDLEDIQIRLDFLCLSLPPEVENLSNMQERTTSYCSTSSPILEPDRCMETESVDSYSIFPEPSGDPLHHLPDFQYQVITKCVEKVKWMLQDEIASAALDTYPLTVSILKMVAEHVYKTTSSRSTTRLHVATGAPGCQLGKVSLQFVFGPDQSFDKFLQEFQRMSLPGYHLEQADDEYYYLVLDNETFRDSRRPVGSLIPPLGVCSKDLLIPLVCHRNDNTELQQKCKTERDDDDDDSHQPSDQGDDCEIMGLPKRSSQEDLRKLKLPDTLCPEAIEEDESEMEEPEQKFRGKARMSRKLSSRSINEKLKSDSRASSVPPLGHDLESSSPVTMHKPGQSCPADLLNLKYILQTKEEEEKKIEDNSEVQSTETVIQQDSDKLDQTGVLEEKNTETTQDEQQEIPDSILPTSTTNVQETMEAIGTLSCSPKVENSPQSQLSSTAAESCKCSPSGFLESSDPFLRDRADSVSSSHQGEEVSNLLGSGATPACRHCLPGSTRSTPIQFSEVDVSSFVGSGHVSNTEDGYDGDSSDSGSDWDWMNALDTKRPHLPPFWLILSPFPDHVDVFFHIRQQPEDSEQLKQGKMVFEQVIKIIHDICKVVNQALLLQHLHETRMCNRLLVPEAAEDIWNQEDEILPVVNRLNSLDESDPQSEYNQSGYLEATARFRPGAFDCNVVWETHFTLHPRLNTGPGRTNASRGIQALRAVLNRFSVNNRKNMFVYKEVSGSVYYLRLHETPCSGHHWRPDEEVSFSVGSRSSSLLSLAQKKLPSELDEELGDFRSRVNSGHSDRDQSHDTISVTSHVSGTRKSQQCIALHVHGIREVGSEVKEDLVKVLQNRLDDSVLEVITTTLARNPMCKLTPDDVQFIQKPGKEPTQCLHFTVLVQLLPYLQAVVEYLRQNLHSYLYTPKYTDTRLESHFKPQSDNLINHKDEDVFLFNRYQAVGTSGSNGIACIVLSVVDGLGRPVQHVNCPFPNVNAFRDRISATEFKELTVSSLYEPDANEKKPGPIALICFQLWCVGKVDIEQLTAKLHSSVCHAFWDVQMEYRMLTSSITEGLDDEPACFSEPPTPIRKTRRSGRETAELIRDKPLLINTLFTSSRDLSSSVPDIGAKVKSPSKEVPSEFTFTEAAFQDPEAFSTPLPISNVSSPRPPARSVEAELSPVKGNDDLKDRGKLNDTFKHVMKSFLDYGEKLGVPSMSRYTCTLKARHAVPLILKEFQSAVKSLTQDTSLKMFVESKNNEGREFIPFNPLISQNLRHEKEDRAFPGSIKQYIVVGRNMQQWKAFMGLTDLYTFLDSSSVTKSHKSSMLFQPYFIVAANHEKNQETSSTAPGSKQSLDSMTPTPMSAPPGDVFPVALESLKLPESDSKVSMFVPRQRLLFLTVENRQFTLYLYNWATDLNTNLCRALSRLLEWNNARTDLLYSITEQKLGLFFNQRLERALKTAKAEQKSQPITQSNTNTLSCSQMLCSYHLEQLVNHHSPPPQRNTETSTHLSRQTQTNIHSGIPGVLEAMRNCRPRTPMHRSSYVALEDPVTRHGRQVQEIKGRKRKDFFELSQMWYSRGANANLPLMEKLLPQVKREARMNHYCLTPLLFSPSWRLKVAQVRDHTLEPLIPSIVSPERAFSFSHSDQGNGQPPRMRHSSGGSQKGAGDTSNGVRMRRMSGTCVSHASQSSPKPRRSASEETWHVAVCANYIQEYIQYLQSLGFVAIQTKQPQTPFSSRSGSSAMTGSKLKEEETASSRRSLVSSATHSLSYPPVSSRPLPTYCLVRWLLGGLMVFEVGFSDPYVFCNLYTLETQRLRSNETRTYTSQFTATFLDELDRVRVMMHMHSFTYDYHLRTIHSYISGRHLLFRHGYHLTSFLDDFVKYYQKSPNYARNLIYSGTVTIQNTSMPPNQLYNYIIGHNRLYGMKVIRMVPVMCDSDAEMDTEYALVKFASKKVRYRDSNDIHQVDSFDVGILTIHDANPAYIEKNTLVLHYYILLTSQRDLFPKLLNFTSQMGSFRPVRLGTSQPASRSQSRKSSSTSNPLDRLRGSNFNSDDSAGSSDETSTPRQRKSSFRGICEEEVTYLGYYSSHETLMQQVMREHAAVVTEELKGVVDKAAIHCRRDFLWKCLISRSFREDSTSSKDSSPGACMTYTEFTELLNFVERVSLNQIDTQLTPILTMHLSWYQGLQRVLMSKYYELHRQFVSPDGNLFHVVVMSQQCLDSFMLLTVNLHTSRAELHLVHRESSVYNDSGGERPNSRTSALHTLVEEFINACCFHLWSGLIG